MENGSVNEREFDLYDLYMIIRKHILLIVSLALISALVAGLFAWFLVDEEYKSDAQVIVQVETTSSTDEYDYTNSLRLINSVVTLFSSDPVLLHVNDELSLGLDAQGIDQLRSNLTVSSTSTDLFIGVSYTSKDPVMAQRIVNQVIDSAIYVTNGGSDIDFLEGVIVRISDAPKGAYDSPNKPLYVIVGGLIGGIIGLSVSLISGFLDNTYKSKDEIQKDLDLQVLGSIPEFKVEEAI